MIIKKHVIHLSIQITQQATIYIQLLLEQYAIVNFNLLAHIMSLSNAPMTRS